MKKLLLPWMAGLGTAVSLVFTSCTYDPYYSSAGGYYGYGDGYGYGGSNFSTSIFVGTGDPRWGYDPYTYCYYDYSSRRYYDPYLYGYYPTGYRPYALYGVPHPHGWRPGHGHLRPPHTVRNVTVTNYRDREGAYRHSNYSWARQVKQRPTGESYRTHGSNSRTYSGSREGYRTGSPDYRTNSTFRRDSQKPQVSPTQEYRGSQPTPYSRGGSSRSNRSEYRPSDQYSPQQAVRSEPRQPASTREVRPESSRGGSMPQPQQSTRQFQRPQENRSRRDEAPRVQAPPSNPPEQKTDSGKSRRGGLRSLGDG